VVKRKILIISSSFYVRIFIVTALLCAFGWASSVNAMKYRDNSVTFSFSNNSEYKLVSGSFSIESFSIPSGQDPDKKITVGLQKTFNSKGKLEFSIGRKGSKTTAKWFSNKIAADQTTFNHTPGKLNFAFFGTLTLRLSGGILGDGGETYTFPNIGLAQGSTAGSRNNWWFGGQDCEHTTGNKVSCTGSNQIDVGVTFEFLRGGNGVNTVDVTATSISKSVCTFKAYSDNTAYNSVFQPTCHNCYEISKAEDMDAKTFKEVLNQVKNVEFDFWDTKDAVTGAKTGEWYVRHDPSTLFSSGNDNVCTGNGKGTNDLRACLSDVNEWINENTNPDVITVFLDKKQDWGDTREPSDLDNLFKEVFGDKLYTPIMFKGNDNRTLRDAAKAGDWPKMQDLKGRVILVLNGGRWNNHNDTISKYVADRNEDALAFAGPDADENSDITGEPNQFTSDTAKWVIFYNIKYGSARNEIGSTVFAEKSVARIWGADDESGCKLISDCINANALYKWNEGGCNTFTKGDLFIPDVSGSGWTPGMPQASYEASCKQYHMMNGRRHDCGNKDNKKKCDENGDTKIYCQEMKYRAEALTWGTKTWSKDITESAGTTYLCPTNQVFTGYKHTGDENGISQYQCASMELVGGEIVAIKANSGFWTDGMTESASEFICPSNYVMNGRKHTGDENGKTKYHCASVPTRD